MGKPVELVVHGDVAVVTIDNPPVNALGQPVRAGLLDAMAQAAENNAIKAIVLTCAGRTFVAGADIREFGKPPQGPDLPVVIAAFENSEKPTVAALFGTALGGGLELALGCHFRVASPEAKCGLPEVKLGILPGSGGTQRLPRLIGVAGSLDMILFGEPVGAEQARDLGLVDAVIEGDLLTGALAFARRAFADRAPLRRLSQLPPQSRPEDEATFSRYQALLRKKARGQNAPEAALRAVRAATTQPYHEGQTFERDLFLELRSSSQSAAMRHIFFAERAAAKVEGIDRNTRRLPIRRVGVLGAGTMGAGIATCFAEAGMDVWLLDREQALAERGVATVARNFAAKASRGQIDAETEKACVSRVTPTTRYEDLADADLVVEAVFEDMQLKREVFTTLARVCRPDAILATNTSTLDVNEIAQASGRPVQVIGMHFFSPAHIMKLLEVVVGKATSLEVLATVMALAGPLGKLPVAVGVCHGFVGNRMLYPYRREALFLVEEGASPQQVDQVLTAFGMPMGPFAMSDLAGLDIGYRVRKAQVHPAGERYSATVADRLVEAGRLGQKTGAGFYRYDEGSRTPIPDPEVDAVVAQVASELGIQRRAVSDEEILERCIFALINEGAKILDEGIAQRSGDVDVVWVHGYGFPVYRGGPMFYADTVGAKTILNRILEFQQAHGDLWRPAGGLIRRARGEGPAWS